MQELNIYSSLLETEFDNLSLPKSPSNLYDPIEYIMGLGGKRLRPSILLMSTEAFGGDVHRSKMAAVAIEVFHNFTLMHDDIMDQAPLRRGKATVHNKWNTTVAILSGDAMMVKAYEYLIKVDPQYLHSSLEIFNKTALEVCEGQQLDMDFEKQDTVSLESYLKMITLKTAVLVGCSLYLGALLAGASANDCNKLYDFGVNLGIAFQLQDDLLDCFGNADKVGKQTGGDILSNKKTFLLITAMETAEEKDKNTLLSLLNDTTLSNEEKVSKVRIIYSNLGIDIKAKMAVEAYTNTALQAIDSLLLGADIKSRFRNLATGLLKRES